VFGICDEFIIASAYFPYDSDEPPPTKEPRDIVNQCCSRKKQLIIGCDANARHIYGGILVPILEEKTSWNNWRVHT
jgi:hypothetical protein